jgi:predicted  nucleic acid-binding Zn-ribbon protein
MEKQEFLKELAEKIGELGQVIEDIKRMNPYNDIDVKEDDRYQYLQREYDELEDELNEIPYGDKDAINEKRDEMSAVKEKMDELEDELDDELDDINSQMEKIDWVDLFDKQYEIWENLDLTSYS